MYVLPDCSCTLPYNLSRHSSSQNNMNMPILLMATPYPSTPIQHLPEHCTVCAARQQRHQVRNDSVSSGETSTDNTSDIDNDLEMQFTANDSTDASQPPPPYSKRRRYQRLDVDPPSYLNAITSPPPGVETVTIPVTVRYTEILILEDDGYSKVICPTARKFKTSIKVYDSMDWNRLWECLKQLKPSITMREDALKEVRGLRRKGKWERVLCARFGGLHLREENWEEMRREICNGDVDKIVVSVTLSKAP
jgi:hypothetical protein